MVVILPIPPVKYPDEVVAADSLYLMEDYTADLCALHGTPNYGSDKTWSLPYIHSLATKNIAAEFLPDFLTN